MASGSRPIQIGRYFTNRIDIWDRLGLAPYWIYQRWNLHLAILLNLRHDRDEVYTAALQYRRSAYKFVLGRISKKNTLLYNFMHFYPLKHSVALSLIHQQWVRALYWPTCHCRPPECTCSQFVGIWNLSPAAFCLASFWLKNCFCNQLACTKQSLKNLKFVTSCSF